MPNWAENTAARATKPGLDAISTTLAYGADVTAGRLLVGFGAAARSLDIDGSGLGVEVEDTRGTDYTVIRGVGQATAAGWIVPFLFYGIAPSSGANTVTLSMATGVLAGLSWTQTEFSGIHTTIPVVGSAEDFWGSDVTRTTTHQGTAITWTLPASQFLVGLALAFQAQAGGDLLVVAGLSWFYNTSYDPTVSPGTEIGQNIGGSGLQHSMAYAAGSEVEPPRPVAYEDPCSIAEPRIFCTITVDDETTLKYGVHPLRDSAAAGGFAEPRLLDMSPMTRVASDPSTGAWSAQTASGTIADTDRVNRAVAEARTSLRNCDAAFYLTSSAQRAAGGPPRVLFAGKIQSDHADPNLTLSFQINDIIGNDYNLFAEEKQIPQRAIAANWFPNAPADAIGKGEPIVYGRRAPRNASNGQGVHACVYVGRVSIGTTGGTPTAATLAALVADLQASKDAGTLVSDWGTRIGWGDAQSLQAYGDNVPSDYDGLAYGEGSFIGIGQGDLDYLLDQYAATGGAEYESVIVASHAIKEILDAANGHPSIWIGDTQVDPAKIGVDLWCPQIPGDTSWASDIGTDLFTDIAGGDGVTRRYTLILFDPSSDYGEAVAGGAVVHVDCIGAEDAGDGTGTAITDYFDIYLHMLTNWILQSYQSGAWLEQPQFLFSDGVTWLDRMDAQSFATASTVAALRLSGGYLGSLSLSDRTSVRDVIARLNLNGGCLLAQDDYQRLVVKVLDTRRTEFLTGRYASGAHRTLRDKVDFLPGFRVEAKPDWQVNRLRFQYARNGFTGQYERGGDGSAAPALVEDTTSQARDGVIEKTLQFDYLADDLTAYAVAGYYVDLFKDMPRVFSYSRRGLCGLEDDVLDGVPITHYAGYGANGCVDHAVLLLSKTFHPKQGYVAFTALSVEGVIAAAETEALVPLMLDPVALEALIDDVSGEPLYQDT